MAERVVVIGASAAGLFAAAAAVTAQSSPHQPASSRSVIVLERDHLPTDSVEARRGVPQGLQPHVFLYRGLLAAEELLAGLRDDLLAAGACPFDTSALAWFGEQGWNNRETSSYQVFSTTRPLLEAIVRRRVAALPGVEIRDGVTVVDVQRQTGGRPAWTVELSDGTRVEAAVVVDASGRNSRLPNWLGEEFASRVRTTEIDARIGYATRMYQGTPDLGDVPGIVIAAMPSKPVGALALPVEGGRWLIGAVGFGEHRPTRGEVEFDEFLAKLRDPALFALARQMKPLGEVILHRQTGNRRRHYEEIKDWPDGLIVLGDAFCAFNPVYGQGIAVAACEAVLLRDALRSGLVPGWSRRLLRRFAGVVELPWSIATGQDLRYPTTGQRPTRLRRLSSRWAMQLGKLSAHGNTRAATTLAAVYHLMAPPRRLLHPALFLAALRGRISGYGPPMPRPGGLPPLET